MTQETKNVVNLEAVAVRIAIVKKQGNVTVKTANAQIAQENIVMTDTRTAIDL